MEQNSFITNQNKLLFGLKTTALLNMNASSLTNSNHRSIQSSLSKIDNYYIARIIETYNHVDNGEESIILAEELQ